MMNTNYDVMNDDAQVAEPKQHKLSKSEYVKKKNEERKELFNIVNEQSQVAVSDSNNYLNFLSIMARTGYTVNNSLLVMKQFPAAKLVKDYEGWKREEIYVKKNPERIKILEPTGTYTRKDGTTGTNYNPKFVFDISQTTEAMNYKEPRYEIPDLVKAITYKADVLPEIASADSILTRDVCYDTSSNKILIKNGLPATDMLKGLLRAYCHVESEMHRHEKHDSFLIDSAAFMLTVKFGVEPKDIKFAEQASNYFLGMDVKDVKHELYQIKTIYDRVEEKMENGLYVRQQEKVKNKDDRQYGR